MVQFSAWIGKTVVDATTGSVLGLVQNLLWQKGERSCLLVTSQGTFAVGAIRLQRKKDVLVATNVAKADNCNNCNEVVGKQIVGNNGKLLGVVADATVTATLRLQKLIADGGKEFSRGNVIAFADVALVRVAVANLAKRQPKNLSAEMEQDNPSVKKALGNSVAEGAIEGTTDGAQTTVESNVDEATSSPQSVETSSSLVGAKSSGVLQKQPHVLPKMRTMRRKCGDFSFLLGKRVDKQVTNLQGEILLRTGDRVSAEALRQAKIAGKLIELCLHTQ